jgi:hypothetical protein
MRIKISLTWDLITNYKNFGHTNVIVDNLFKYEMSKYELFIFL